MNITTKRCSSCKIPKSINTFHRNKSTKDGFTDRCKDCRKRYYQENKEKIIAYQRYRQRTNKNVQEYRKKYRQSNKEKLRIWFKKYYQENKLRLDLKNALYIKLHPEQKKVYEKKYREHNKEKTNLRARNYRQYNEKVKIGQNISANIRNSLKEGQKNHHHWESLVDFTLNQLIKHLKKFMPEGYIWQDYLDGKLHIDHKIPISAFNFSKAEHIDFRRCWALDNLRLLPAKMNLEKGNKLDKPFQPSLAI